MLALENDGFMFKFEYKMVLNWVLEGGSWFIAQRPLLLQKWMPGFVLEKLSMHKFPLWVKFWQVPLELFTSDGLSHISWFIAQSDRATQAGSACWDLC